MKNCFNNLFCYYLGGLTVATLVMWMQGAPLGKALFRAGAWPLDLAYVLYLVFWVGA